MTTVFVVATLSPKFKSLLQIIHLGYIPGYFFAGLLLLILWFASYFQRCSQYVDLSERVAPEMTAHQSCGSSIAVMVLMWIGIIAFITVQLYLASINWTFFRLRKKEEKVKEALEFDVMKSDSEVDSDINVVLNFPTEPEVVRNRILFLIMGIVIGISIMIAVLVIVISPGMDDLDREGTCPVQNLFLQTPQENDLDCCLWQEQATCCHRKVCFGNKPNAPHGIHDNCDSLLGLLNCAPCRNDSFIFMSHLDVKNPWNDGIITVCTDFCQQIFTSCQPYLQNGSRTCGWGDSCTFSSTPYDKENYDGTNLADRIKFCMDFGMGVSDDQYQCYNHANSLNYNSILCIIFIIVSIVNLH